MSPEALVSFASKRGIEFRIVSGRLKAFGTGGRELTNKETLLLREHREAIRSVVSCPFYTTGLIASVLRGEAEPSSIAYLLDCPDTDENDRLWVERALSGWRYDESGNPAAPLQVAAPLPELPPELCEIRQGLKFNGGECAARSLVALCRLSGNVGEIESRLREGEPLGLWKRTERRDTLGFAIWTLLACPRRC